MGGPTEGVGWTLQQHFIQIVCLANNLQSLYPLLREDALPYARLRAVVQHCRSNATREAASSSWPPKLDADPRYLSRFLVQTCESYALTRASGPAEMRGPQSPRSVTDPRLLTVGIELRGDRPSHLVLNETILSLNVPRWAWDKQRHPPFEAMPKVVEPMPGHERELAFWPLFAQNLGHHRHHAENPERGPAAKPMLGRAPRWRRSGHPEWEQGLSKSLEYKPRRIWIEPEIWVQPRGRVTRFHYDYDPHSLLFQVYGSRQVQILPPESGLLRYEFWKEPRRKPADFGTRWAEPIGTVEPTIVDLQEMQLLKIPNGWPHRVVYMEDSIGIAVRSWTQCQALATWIGQRLCQLSTILGLDRICFDDEYYREHGGYRSMENALSSPG